MTLANKMKKSVLAFAAIATLASSVAATEASAAGYMVNTMATTSNFPGWDRLNIRKWPAAHSQKVAHIKRYRSVYVQRCIIKQGADWCKIQKGWKVGWVNGKYLVKGGQNFASPHYTAYNWH